MWSRLMQTAAAQLPSGLRFELRRLKFSRQIHRGRFGSPEPEILDVTRHLRRGDWVIDVGANVGHYTCHMASCVGARGRVLAFEPIPVSFALLSANVQAAGLSNVTLFNIALSSHAGLSRMTVPSYEYSNLENFYRAHIADEGETPVMCLPLDAIPVPGAVRLVKVDAEGHDLDVLQGMESLLLRDRPVSIVEGSPEGHAARWLTERGFSVRCKPTSSNFIAVPASGHGRWRRHH
jgi:FkbM family methyltransferase